MSKNRSYNNMNNQEVKEIKAGLALMKATNLDLIGARSELLSETRWECGDELYEQQSWKSLFEMMLQSEAQVLRLHCSQQDIIPSIIHIRFVQLQIITFADNNIESIESLIFLNAPSLYQLDLEMNHINSIRPLRKCFFPEMSSISLSQNNICDMNILTFCNFPVLENISLEYLDNTVMGQEINWLLRLETEHIWNFRRHQIFRIKQKRVEWMATKRYMGMRFTF